MTRSKNSLAPRWTSADARKASKRILATLKSGGKLAPDASPFGVVGGLLDFRGLPFPDGITISRCRVENADLSRATLRSAWMQGNVFENVCFDQAMLAEISDQGNTFRNCSFSGTSFRGAAIGYLGSCYSRCTFEKAIFRKAIFIRAEIDDCVFDECKLSGVDFDATSFVNCSFIGKLDDVWFRGGFPLPSDIAEFGKPRPNLMKDVSFANASLWGLTFSNNCDLSTVVIPSTGNYRLYSSWEQRLTCLKEAVSAWPSSEQSEGVVFVSSHLVHAKQQDWFLLNCDEVNEEFGEVLGSKLIEILDKSEKDGLV